MRPLVKLVLIAALCLSAVAIEDKECLCQNYCLADEPKILASKCAEMCSEDAPGLVNFNGQFLHQVSRPNTNRAYDASSIDMSADMLVTAVEVQVFIASGGNTAPVSVAIYEGQNYGSITWKATVGTKNVDWVKADKAKNDHQFWNLTTPVTLEATKRYWVVVGSPDASQPFTYMRSQDFSSPANPANSVTPSVGENTVMGRFRSKNLASSQNIQSLTNFRPLTGGVSSPDPEPNMISFIFYGFRV